MEMSPAELERVQSELQALQAERRLLSQSLEFHERDRQLLAFEIHDGIIQDMTAALMFLEAAGGKATFGDAKGQETYSRGLRMLRESVAEARRLIRGLIPVQLDERGLATSLEKLVEKFRTDQGMEIDFAANVQLHHLVPAVELIVLRIVQEALNNVWKHSQSLVAQVQLVQHADALEVIVHDRGVGFDPAQVKPTRYGLAGIRERARLVGGQATIESEAGQGTHVSVRIPLAETLLPPDLHDRAPV
jgi:signal transduction histidine kinase